MKLSNRLDKHFCWLADIPEKNVDDFVPGI